MSMEDVKNCLCVTIIELTTFQNYRHFMAHSLTALTINITLKTIKIFKNYFPVLPLKRK